ncbi:MAG: type IV secretion system DNA-binding domain-containing protein [Anaerolineaceae bacterium]|nr:type IV secretion system DNA-binding domain-containing protein [Anaerolineaceae bacterium]
MGQSEKALFYLGRTYEPASRQVQEEALLYDPANLTTHAIVTGMTGSGKTGVCIAMLEEAALQGVPAIIIDPKGDLTNLVLHFPELSPQDFEPWIDPEEARRQGKPLPELAVDTAERWKNGLAQWGLGRGDLLKLQSAVDYSVYTPGSSAGIPVNILSSFSAPDLPWEENREILREKIASTVTALLGLVGLEDVDPLRSREHILLSNLLEHAWSQYRPVDLTDLILQIQNPPMERLGAFPLNSFFPEKDRLELAMLLNNFLASPSFQTWLEGQSLDVQSLLYTPDGRPRHSIFYLAHLDENERMFFVTLLLASVEAWMRGLRGTSGLRALVYFDEIMGYLPPVRNPPSRPVLLRMLKQARAFGVGLLLATQNPVDLDYKALSNAGTWVIGRLQTDQDKQRLLDGLENVAGTLDRSVFDRTISGLEKRVFLLHNVHQPGPRLFYSRWTLNFLAGPVTRAQVPALNRLAGAAGPGGSTAAGSTPPARPALRPAPSFEMTQAVPVETAPAAGGGETQYLRTQPVPPSGFDQVFLPAEVGVARAAGSLKDPASGRVEAEGILYRPALYAQAQIRYTVQKYNLAYQRQMAVMVTASEGTLLRWDDSAWRSYAAGQLQTQAMPAAQFVPLPAWLGDGRRLKLWQKDFVDWLYRTGAIRVRANTALKVYADPDVGPAELRERCGEAAKAALAVEQDKLEAAFVRKIEALRRKVSRQNSEVDEQQQEVEQRRMEEWGTHGELALSIFSKRRRSVSSSFTKHRLTQQAQADLEQEKQELRAMQGELGALEEEYKQSLAGLQEKWAQAVNDIQEVPVNPQKSNIFVEFYGIAWLPYYLVRVGGQLREAPAFEPAMK